MIELWFPYDFHCGSFRHEDSDEGPSGLQDSQTLVVLWSATKNPSLGWETFRIMGQEFGLLGECIASRTCRGLADPEDSD